MIPPDFLKKLERQTRQDIGIPFAWLESQVNDPALFVSIGQSSIPSHFADLLQCGLHIFKRDFVTAGALLRAIDSQGDPYRSKDLLTGLFYAAARDTEKAANGYFKAINQHKGCLYGWRKLFDLSFDAGLFTQGLQWHRQALSLSHWNEFEQILLLQAGSSFHLQLYQFEQSIAMMRRVIALQMGTTTPLPPADEPTFSPERAWEALGEFLDFLKPYDLQVFPTAGTLLGWQRDGKILPFDKDLDLALLPGRDHLTLALKVLSGFPRYEMTNRVIHSPSYAAIADRKTGVAFDLLEFWEADGRLLYGWRLPGKYRLFSRELVFTPFTLVEDVWNGRPMWRPDNPDRYLTELYGDWRTPDPHFDSCAGSCNLLRFTPLVQAMTYSHLSSALTRGKFAKVRTFIASLRRHGDRNPLLDHLEDWLQQRTAS